MNVNVFIEGVPYGQRKARGDMEAPRKWTDTIVQQTRHVAKVKGPCAMGVFFVLPEDKYPSDLPYGPDLDNYLKRLCDGLNQTIFSDVQGYDSAVVCLVASKCKASQDEAVGARVIIQELNSDYSVRDRAMFHTFTELELLNICTSLKADYEMIQKSHDAIHEFIYLAPVCLPNQSGVSWHSKSAFLTYLWEAFHQAHRSFLEALSGYYNAAYILLRSTLELLLKGAFWECLAHQGFRDRATRLDKGKGKRKSVKDWVDALIAQEPSTKKNLEETSAAIFDKTAILFDDRRFQRHFVQIPPFPVIIEQLIEWQIVDIPGPFEVLYGVLYRNLSRDVHVIPDATDVGRRLISERDFMEIEVMPEELTKYMKNLHEVIDIGIVVELNILREWIELGGKAELRKRLDILQDLDLKYSVGKLKSLIA